MDCIFCKIASGEIKAKTIQVTQEYVAFYDLNPQAPVHVLIVPVKHIASLSAASDGDLELLGTLQIAAKKLAAELKLDGFRLVLNNGKIAGQSVDHIHYHLLGGRRLLWPPG